MLAVAQQQPLHDELKAAIVFCCSHGYIFAGSVVPDVAAVFFLLC